MGGTVKEIKEKRGSTRNPAGIGIVCQPYSSANGIRRCTGVLRNYSSGGIYIEAPHEYKPGTILFIRAIHLTRTLSGLPPGEGCRTVCLAEVKWRQELSDQQSTRYGMGLGYLN